MLSLLENDPRTDGVPFVHVGDWEPGSWDGVPDGSHPCDSERLYLIQQMKERGLVAEKWGSDDGFNLYLTPDGHDRANWYRDNVWYRRFFRVLASWLDKAMASIFLPIVAAVLTVVVMNLLGLSGAQNP